MKVVDVLKQSKLPALEAELLVAEVLGKDRTWILAHGDEQVSEEQLVIVDNLIKRRKNAEPIAYIIGKKEFYGRDYVVSPDVLIPRPATEGLVDAALAYLKNQNEEITEIDTDIVAFTNRFNNSDPEIIVDIGTGSGCIAITLALETDRKIIATDISQNALSLAKQNSEYHSVSDRIEFREGSLLKPIMDIDVPFLLVSNPPYIPEEEELMKDVSEYEPKDALFAGSDGMSILKQLTEAAQKNPHCTGLVFECKQVQAENLQKIL